MCTKQKLVSVILVVSLLLLFTAIVNANEPPVADADGPYVVEAESPAGASVTLDGSGSSDPDGDPLTYNWGWDSGSAAGVSPTITFPFGTTEVTLTVDDGKGLADSDIGYVSVVDTTPPTITCPDDVTVESESPDGTVVPLEFTATDICDPDPVIASDEPETYLLGETVVTFSATDASGNVALCSMTVTVVDTTPPEVACSTSPDVLWPRNNQMVSVEVFIAVSDNGTETSNLYLSVEVASSDPDDTKDGEEKFMGDVNGDDGYTVPVDVTDEFVLDNGFLLGTVMLRAECVGKNDRIYTIKTTATDSSGNQTEKICEVTVLSMPKKGGPH